MFSCALPLTFAISQKLQLNNNLSSDILDILDTLDCVSCGLLNRRGTASDVHYLRESAKSAGITKLTSGITTLERNNVKRNKAV